MHDDLCLLDTTLPRTLDTWVAQFEQPAWHGAQIQGWLFEGVEARRAAERRLAAAGVSARLRSAYKPLLHYFLEEVDIASLAEVKVHYPVHPGASPRRFLLETYPLAGLLPNSTLALVPGTDPMHYQLAIRFHDGREQQARVFAPNRIHMAPLGASTLSPTGWLRARRNPALGPSIDGAETTDYEALFAQLIHAVQQHPWSAQEPYFERLDLRIDLPTSDQPLALPDECISLSEAMHEDVYFSLLEIFQHHSGRPASDRRLQPGQIVPDVRTGATQPRLRITARRFDVEAQDARAGTEPVQPGASTNLAELGKAPSPQRIAAEMAALGGQRFRAQSRQGRPVHGLYHPGSGAPVLISGGQHANETSGVVGALRAAQVLQARSDSHFALIALENPDGYALHRELCAQHPQQMHHAARYSALGDDIEYRETAPWFEREARDTALSLSQAQLHINLHGYPAHEWTRPLSGYIPKGFELWTIPKGFFLILRYQPGWQAHAHALLDRVGAALTEVPGMLAFNRRQMDLYERHAGELSFRTIHGTAYTETETTKPGAAVTLITEFPDETIEGDAFRFAHSVQTATVLAAVEAWRHLMHDLPRPAP